MSAIFRFTSGQIRRLYGYFLKLLFVCALYVGVVTYVERWAINVSNRSVGSGQPMRPSLAMGSGPSNCCAGFATSFQNCLKRN